MAKKKTTNKKKSFLARYWRTMLGVVIVLGIVRICFSDPIYEGTWAAIMGGLAAGFMVYFILTIKLKTKNVFKNLIIRYGVAILIALIALLLVWMYWPARLGETFASTIGGLVAGIMVDSATRNRM